MQVRNATWLLVNGDEQAQPAPSGGGADALKIDCDKDQGVAEGSVYRDLPP